MKRKHLIGVMLIIFLVFSCSIQQDEQELGITNNTYTQPEQIDAGGEVVLGKKLNNPYTIENMLLAKKELLSRGIEVSEKILVSHYYIRFLPRDENDVDKLNFNNDLILFDYPLDYELLSEGSAYRDSDIPEGQPNAQYTAVKIDQKLPDVPYEILEELYIPDTEENSSRSISTSPILLENEAFKITGNKTSSNPESRGKWYPEGRIMLWDDVLKKDVPVPDVEVRARNFVRFRRTHTNSNGYFKLGYFRGKDVGFSIKWEASGEKYDIRSGNTGQAFYNGPNKKTSWYHTFNTASQEDLFRARLFRAAWFYYNNDFDLGSKMNNVSILAQNRPYSDDPAYYNNVTRNIKVYSKNKSGSYFKADRIFYTVNHEFGHAHHDKIFEGGSVYYNSPDSVKEPWAVVHGYMQAKRIYGTKLRYNTYISHADWRYYRGISGDDFNYNPIMIDLIDDYDQSSWVKYNLNDEVKGYTLKQMMNIVKKESCTGINEFIDEVKKLPLPSGITATARDNYLDQYSQPIQIRWREGFEGGWGENLFGIWKVKHYSSNRYYTSDFRLTGKVESFMMREGSGNKALVTYISDRGTKPEDLFAVRNNIDFNSNTNYKLQFKARTENGHRRYIKVAITNGNVNSSGFITGGDTTIHKTYRIDGQLKVYDLDVQVRNTGKYHLVIYMGDFPNDTYSKDVIVDNVKVIAYY